MDISLDDTNFSGPGNKLRIMRLPLKKKKKRKNKIKEKTRHVVYIRGKRKKGKKYKEVVKKREKPFEDGERYFLT